jgi:hypothetical protein
MGLGFGRTQLLWSSVCLDAGGGWVNLGVQWGVFFDTFRGIMFHLNTIREMTIMEVQAASAWHEIRGIACEPAIDKFVDSIGGQRLSALFPNATFQNADYIFKQQKVLVELKILETEFGDTAQFKLKEHDLYRQAASQFGAAAILKQEPEFEAFICQGLRVLYRDRLNRISKRANKQIRETKLALGDDGYRGVLWLINDGFRGIGTDIVFGLLCNGLAQANSQVRALVYLTNHFVALPGNDYANFLWMPAYADAEADDLPDFVNWLGKEWGDFTEREDAPYDNRISGPSIDSRGIHPLV